MSEHKVNLSSTAITQELGVRPENPNTSVSAPPASEAHSSPEDHNSQHDDEGERDWPTPSFRPSRGIDPPPANDTDVHEVRNWPQSPTMPTTLGRPRRGGLPPSTAATPATATHQPRPNNMPPTATPPNRNAKLRSFLTPAGIASQIAVGTLGIKDRLRFEGQNNEALKIINAAGALAVAGRIAYGLYAAYKGYGTGQVNTEAMQMASDSLHSPADGISSTATENAAPRMEQVAYGIPFDDGAETHSKPAVDLGDVAPEAVKLGEWKSENSDDGTVWGSTMDYMEQMGVDTDELTDKEEYEIVDDMLKANQVGGEGASEAERWEAAKHLSSDFEVELPSANDMEELMDRHGIKHDELVPTVKAPVVTETITPAPSASAGNTDTNTQPGMTESQPTPSATPSEPAPSAASSATPEAPASAASPESSVSVSPPTPESTASAAPEQKPVANTSGNWDAVGHEALDTLWQSAALYAGSGVAGGLDLAAKKGVKKRLESRRANASSPSPTRRHRHPRP